MTTAQADPHTTSRDPLELRPDPVVLARFWDALVTDGEVHEVRIPTSRPGPARLFGVVSGYFDSRDAFVRAVARFTGRDAEGVYVTLNPVQRDLLARAYNRLINKAKATTADQDVTRRRHLLIDADAVRASLISATDDERDLAVATREAIAAYLSELGWPSPVIRGMTGNGGELVYRIDLPNDDASTQLITDCLAALAAAFNTDGVTIDQSVCNAARITKVIGSVPAKGDPVPDLGRVWRVATAEFDPDAPVVARALLEALAADAPRESRATTDNEIVIEARAESRRSWHISDLLAKQQIGYRTKPWQGGTVYELNLCLTSQEHTDGARIIELASGALAYRCHHDRCRGKGWGDVRAVLGLPDAAGAGRGAGGTGRSSMATVRPVGPVRAERPWPEGPGAPAFRGLAGRVVELIAPFTEADPIAVLVNFLIAFACAVGSGPHMLVGATRHPAHTFAVLVGKTSKARKGDSWQPVRELFRLAAPDWIGRVLGGLSSGEGLIWAVRDPIEKQEPVKEKGRVMGYERVVVDEGISDKRLLVIEPEYARVLRVMSRQGNTLSPVLRAAWDTGDLRIMTKQNAAAATGAHIALLGHITVEELRRELPDMEGANGFANRFLHLLVRRSRDLPEPQPFGGEAVIELATSLAEALARARTVGQMTRDPEARELWHAVYKDLADEREGLAGAILARAEAHVLRLSLAYALLDGSAVVTVDHLAAALEVWGYAERSAAFIFGDATGDPIADTILAALRQNGELTRTQISDLFGRHASADRIARALQTLLAQGKVRMDSRQTGGRPVEVWRAA